MKNRAVVALLAILVIIIGVLAFVISDYDFSQTKKYRNELTKIESTSESDEIEDIENDLNSTSFENIDSELNSLEGELSY